MKLQLTQKIEIREISYLTSLLIEGLREFTEYVKTNSFENIEELKEYGLHSDVFLSNPLKTSFLLDEGFNLGFIELV